jgi:hypothetical protein
MYFYKLKLTCPKIVLKQICLIFNEFIPHFCRSLYIKVQSPAINFVRQCHFKIWLDCHKFKKNPRLIILTSIKCQKIEKKNSIINVSQ